MSEFKAVDTARTKNGQLALHRPFSSRKKELKIVDVYKPEKGLVAAADVAMILGTPLLLTGEPGSGKTSAAFYLARKLDLPDPLEHNVKSSSSAKDLLYSFDEVARFRDSASGKAEGKPLISYLRMNALGEAIVRAAGGDAPLTDPFGRQLDPSVIEAAFGLGVKEPTAKLLLGELEKDPLQSDPQIRMVLLDEIDKAARDTPNDLLVEIDKMRFAIPELGIRVAASDDVRPIVIMTSNSERSLPEPFLRRCAFFHIPIPEEGRMNEIVDGTMAGLSFGPAATRQMVAFFYQLRDMREIAKRPSTSELVAWIDTIDQRGALGAHSDLDTARADKATIEGLKGTLGALAKNAQDLEMAIKALDLTR